MHYVLWTISMCFWPPLDSVLLRLFCIDVFCIDVCAWVSFWYSHIWKISNNDNKNASVFWLWFLTGNESVFLYSSRVVSGKWNYWRSCSMVDHWRACKKLQYSARIRLSLEIDHLQHFLKSWLKCSLSHYLWICTTVVNTSIVTSLCYWILHWSYLHHPSYLPLTTQ